MTQSKLNPLCLSNFCFLFVFSISYLIFDTQKARANSQQFTCGGAPSNSFFVPTPQVELDPGFWVDSENVRSKVIILSKYFSRRKWMSDFPKSWKLTLDSSITNLLGFVHPGMVDEEGRPVIEMHPRTFLTDMSLGRIAHEMIHILHDTYRPHEKWWIKEGLAIVGQYLLTCNQELDHLESYSLPRVSLVFEPANHDPSRINLRPQYSLIQLYFNFIHRNCGGEELFLKLLRTKSNKIGIPFMDEILKQMYTKTSAIYCQDFRSSFIQFQYARYKQSLRNASEYVAIGKKFQYPIFQSRQYLPPYSGIVYEKSKACESDDINIGRSHCLQVRLD